MIRIYPEAVFYIKTCLDACLHYPLSRRVLLHNRVREEMVVEVVAVESQAGGSCFSVYFLAPLSS